MIKTMFIATAAVAFAATAASAADLPSRIAPPVFVPPPVAGYSWTGFEFGLTTSYAFSGRQNVYTSGNDDAANGVATGTRPGVVSMRKSGFDDVGGEVGYNYQFTPGSGFVVGGIVDVSYLNLKKNNTVYDDQPLGFGDPSQSYFHQRLSYLGTANGRLGYAFDHLLIYGVGGFAFGGVHNSTSLYNSGLGETYYGTSNKTMTGYDYGGGAEYAIPNDSFLNYLSVEKLFGFDKTLGLNIFESTIRAEFIHYNLGTSNVLVRSTAAGPVGSSYSSRFKSEGNLVRVGLGYKYSPVASPVVARY